VFSQLSYPGQTGTRVAWEQLRSESLHESFLNSHAPVKREQELHESWEARVCMRVFSSPSQTRTRVAWELRSELMHESFLNSHAPVKRENKSCVRVEKREFAWEFSQLSCPGQTRTRVAWELMRVEKREFAWECSQPSSAPVKREHELRESWLDITEHVVNWTLIKIWTSSELMIVYIRVGGETRVRVASLINSRLTEGRRGLRVGISRTTRESTPLFVLR
jgi:hypothetical protein